MLTRRPDGHYSRQDWCLIDPEQLTVEWLWSDEKTEASSFEALSELWFKAWSSCHGRVYVNVGARKDFDIGPLKVTWDKHKRQVVVENTQSADNSPRTTIQMDSYGSDDKAAAALEDALMEAAVSHRLATTIAPHPCGQTVRVAEIAATLEARFPSGEWPTSARIAWLALKLVLGRILTEKQVVELTQQLAQVAAEERNRA